MPLPAFFSFYVNITYAIFHLGRYLFIRVHAIFNVPRTSIFYLLVKVGSIGASQPKLLSRPSKPVASQRDLLNGYYASFCFNLLLARFIGQLTKVYRSPL